MTHTDANERARALMDESRWEEAIALATSVAVEGRTAELNWNHGWALFHLDRFEEAAHALRRSIQQHPESAHGHWALGLVLSELGDWEAAEKHYLTALAYKDGGLARLSLAILYMRQDRFDEAERVHLEGLRLKPEDRERLEAYADFLDDAGRESEAEAARRKAATLLPRPPRLRRFEPQNDD